MTVVCASVGDYCNALARLRRGQGDVPILAPEEPERLARWRSILDWYGLERSTVELVPLDERAWIVALDRELVELAEAYASARGRRFHNASEGWDPAVFEAEHAPQSVCVVARPARLTYARVLAIGDALDCPWGMLTALDSPGLSFVLAKTLADGSRGGSTLVDALHGRFAYADSVSAAPSTTALTAAPLVEQLRERDHAQLVICAHGEGSHMYLVSAVLCGLVGEQEHSLDGQPLDGCRTGPGTERHCKRVPDGSLPVVGHGQLRAADLALLTCGGLSVAGQQYLSTSSAVLAVLEGYARSVLTTVDFCDYGPWVGPTLRSLLAAGIAPGTAAWLLDDILARRVGQRPIVLVGDPAGSVAEFDALPEPPRLEPSTRPRVYEGTGGTAAVLGCRPPTRTVLRGRRTLVELPTDRKRTGDVELFDATERLDAAEARARWLRDRMAEAAAVVRALRAKFLPRDAPPDRSASFAAIREAHEQIEGPLREVLILAEDTRRHGVWRPRLESQLTSLLDRVDVWDARVATLLGELLHRRVDAALMRTARGVEDWPGDRCERCQTPLRRTRGEDLWGLPPMERRQCPNCDIMELRARDDAGLRVTLPSKLARGQRAAIEIEVPREAIDADMQASVGHQGRLAVVLMDKGHGQPLLTWTGTIRSTRRFEFDVPETLSPTLHSLEVAWVRAMRIAVVRRRTAGLP